MSRKMRRRGNKPMLPSDVTHIRSREEYFTMQEAMVEAMGSKPSPATHTLVTVDPVAAGGLMAGIEDHSEAFAEEQEERAAAEVFEQKPVRTQMMDASRGYYVDPGYVSAQEMAYITGLPVVKIYSWARNPSTSPVDILRKQKYVLISVKSMNEFARAEGRQQVDPALFTRTRRTSGEDAPRLLQLMGILPGNLEQAPPMSPKGEATTPDENLKDTIQRLLNTEAELDRVACDLDSLTEELVETQDKLSTANLRIETMTEALRTQSAQHKDLDAKYRNILVNQRETLAERDRLQGELNVYKQREDTRKTVSEPDEAETLLLAEAFVRAESYLAVTQTALGKLPPQTARGTAGSAQDLESAIRAVHDNREYKRADQRACEMMNAYRRLDGLPQQSWEDTPFPERGKWRTIVREMGNSPR